MKVEKIIFLDFDGVIITPRTNFLKFDPICIELLQDLVNRSGSFLVISSSWRIGNTFRAIRAMFDGFDLFDKVIGMTPVHNSEWVRGQEIDEWLKNPKLASSRFDLDLKGFVILDDDSDMSPHMDKLVQSEWDGGLTKELVEKAILVLDIPV